MALFLVSNGGATAPANRKLRHGDSPIARDFSCSRPFSAGRRKRRSNAG